MCTCVCRLQSVVLVASPSVGFILISSTIFLLLFYPYPNLNYLLGPSFKVIFFSDYFDFDLICI